MPAVGVIAVLSLLAAGVVLFLTRQAIVSTEAHDVATAWVRTHQVVHAKLGEEIRFGFMPVGQVTDSTADLTLNLTGDQASGRVQLSMTHKNGEWVITHAILESPEGRLIIAEQRPEDLGPSPESQHHVTRSAQLLNSGRTSEALKEVEQAVIIDAYNPHAYVWRGFVQVEMGHLDKARGDFAKAIELDAGVPDASHGMALTYALKDDYEGAMPHLDRWVQLAPDSGEAWQERGYAAFKLGKTDQAIADATKACELGFQAGCLARDKLGGPPVPEGGDAPEEQPPK